MDEIEDKLEKLQCPFTWDGITSGVALDKESPTVSDEQYFPLVMLIHHLTYVCLSVVNGDDFESACAKLAKCDKDLKSVEEKAHQQISLKVVRHLVQATKIHVFLRYGKMDECELQLQDVDSLHEIDAKDRGTLEACKSIAWSKYDLSKSIDFISKAVQHNPNCDLWHYTLGKELRRKRRDDSIQSIPRQEEFDCFKKAFDLARNPFCGVMYAQALRESCKYKEAEQIYNEIYNETRADEAYMLLKLALGFIQCQDFLKAEECLDRVAATDGKQSSLYAHYRGMFHMKKGQFKHAIGFLEKAITDNHFGVEKQYLYCKVQADKSFDATNDVLRMIDKYKDSPVNVRQHLLLELAMCYENKNRINEAVECFTKAIQMDPESSILKRFDCCVNRTSSTRHVYLFIRKHILPQVQNLPSADALRKLVYNH